MKLIPKTKVIPYLMGRTNLEKLEVLKIYTKTHIETSHIGLIAFHLNGKIHYLERAFILENPAIEILDMLEKE